MEGRVRVWAALQLLLTVAAVTASPNRPGPSDPCARHTCRRGEECVVHEVNCQQQPCPRIGECRAVDCSLPCLPGYECARRPCLEAPCDTRERCVPAADACRGRCHPVHELCLSRVQPCKTPPCPEESVCLPRHTVLTARNQPPPPSFCHDCPAPAVCVPTQVCRQQNECLYLPVCITNCTSMWCGQDHVCRMQRLPCGEDQCPLQPTCVPDTDAAPSQPEPELELALGNRFNSGPARPQCVVPCTPDEECSQAPTRCSKGPCPRVWRCRPRGRPDHSSLCPLDDLRELASTAFCDVSLHQCEADGDCGQQRRCCARGCGNTCLPVCRLGCESGTECRLVEVQCIGSPCPKVAQCVAEEPPLHLPSPPPPPPPQFKPSSQPSAGGFGGSAAGSHSSVDGFGSNAAGSQSSVDGFGSSAAGSHSSVDGFGGSAAGSQSSAGGFGGSAAGSQSSVEGFGSSAADVPSGDRPGLCPVNDRQTQSIICFDNGSVDKCARDASCPPGMRCCLRGCQQLCRPVCDACAGGLQCRLQWPNQPVCGQPVDQEDPRRIRTGSRLRPSRG